ncbi:hypothetical protein V5799_019586 [Amblyomma americanum]|uniref:MIT domain-containing protein n=1 Tax=Amblyomma americanum TaxID=6943 RepID=A0AAQ4EX82_AMBAM
MKAWLCCYMTIWSAEKFSALFVMVSEYLQRAETLKSALKSREAIVIDDDSHGGGTEFEDICDRYPPLQSALLLVNTAKKLAVANRLKDALKTYQDALDIVIPFMAQCRPDEKEVLRAEVKKWLEAAELVKSYMAMQSMEVERVVPVKSEQSCTIQ